MLFHFILKNREIIDTICNVFIAFGTVGAVITALWLAYKDSKPRLKVYATVAALNSDSKKYFWASCVNLSKQNIIFNHFSIAPRKFGKQRSYCFLITKEAFKTSSSTSDKLEYSSRMDHYYDLSVFSESHIKSLLSNHRWIAVLQLKRWRVVVNTNVKKFEGKLSGSLREAILDARFKEEVR